MYTFKFIEDYSQILESDLLETNLVTFLNWGFLECGGYENVSLSTTSCYDNINLSKLKLSTDKRYPEGSVWTGLRADWVWESGVSYSPSPIPISGIYINSTFYPTSTTGNYAYHINYPLGQIYFENAIPKTAEVKVEHSYKKVQIRSSNEPWFQTVQSRSFRPDEDGSLGAIAEVVTENKVQLPAIIVESVGNARAYPLEIGNCGRIQNLDVNFHIITESPEDRKRIHDILINQWDTKIKTFNENDIDYPLNVFGTPVSGAKSYPELCQAHPWETLRFTKVVSSDPEQVGKNMWWMSIRGTFEFNIS